MFLKDQMRPSPLRLGAELAPDFDVAAWMLAAARRPPVAPSAYTGPYSPGGSPSGEVVESVPMGAPWSRVTVRYKPAMWGNLEVSETGFWMAQGGDSIIRYVTTPPGMPEHPSYQVWRTGGYPVGPFSTQPVNYAAPPAAQQAAPGLVARAPATASALPAFLQAAPGAAWYQNPLVLLGGGLFFVLLMVMRR